MKNQIGKVVWITGASSGIGEALAYAYANKKNQLILTARNQEKLELVQKNCLAFTDSCMILPMDLTSTSELNEAVNKIIIKHKRIDILINNAGISQRSLAMETPLEIDRKIMEINFFSTIALTKLVLPIMNKQKSGYIGVISSISGKFGFPMRTAYSASKHALQGFFESLSTELNDSNIKVSIISPGRIKTNISYNAMTKDGTNYGRMDDGQANGMDVDVCANKIVRAIEKGKKDVLIGRKEILLVYIHRYLPLLYYRIVNKIKN